MCIIPQNKLSAEDLAFLAARSASYEPDSGRHLAIQERSKPGFEPACISQLVRSRPRRPLHAA